MEIDMVSQNPTKSMVATFKIITIISCVSVFVCLLKQSVVKTALNYILVYFSDYKSNAYPL